MAISRERLNARLEELKQELEKCRQQFAALTGAIADANYWLAELDRSESAPDEP